MQFSPKWLIFLLPLSLAFQTSFAEPDSPASSSNWLPEYYETYDVSGFLKFPPALQEVDEEHPDIPLLNAALFYETNRRRIAFHRQPFQYSPELEKAAQMHSDDMVKYSFFSHANPVDPARKTVKSRIQLAGLAGNYLGENITTGYGLALSRGHSLIPPRKQGDPFLDNNSRKPLERWTYITLAEALLDTWMDSPHHKENILRKEFEYLGCGISFYNEKKFHNFPMVKATQDFSGDNKKTPILKEGSEL